MPQPIARREPVSKATRDDFQESIYRVCTIEFAFDRFATSAGDNTNALYVEDPKRLISSCRAKFPKLKVLEFAHAPSCLALRQKKLYFDTVTSALLKVPLRILTELKSPST